MFIYPCRLIISYTNKSLFKTGVDPVHRYLSVAQYIELIWTSSICHMYQCINNEVYLTVDWFQQIETIPSGNMYQLAVMENAYFMMASSNGNIFRVTGPLCREFPTHRWIPLTKASGAEFWSFFWSAPWINRWVNIREAGDLRRHRAHYDVIVMWFKCVSGVGLSSKNIIIYEASYYLITLCL